MGGRDVGCSCTGKTVDAVRYIEDCVDTTCNCYEDGVFHGSCTRACATDPCSSADSPCCGAAFGLPL